MKQMYICEYCGKQSSDQGEIYDCEISHIQPQCILDRVNKERLPMTYKEGSAFPTTIPVLFESYNGSKSEYEYSVGVYEFKKLSPELLKSVLVEKEQERLEREERYRKDEEKRVSMLAELQSIGVDTSDESLKYSWSVRKLYKQHFPEQS